MVQKPSWFGKKVNFKNMVKKRQPLVKQILIMEKSALSWLTSIVFWLKRVQQIKIW